MSFKLKKLHDWSYFFIPWIKEQNICHGFFTKASPSKIVRGENDQSFLKAFSLTEAIVMHQEHSDAIHIIENSERPVSGDAIILIQKRVAAIIKTADCLPIIISDLKYPMAAIAHAGWRGTYDAIAKKTIEKMADNYNTNPKDLVCIIGPSIGPCCYEVSKDLVEKFNMNFTNSTEKFYTIEEDKYKLDLWKVNEHILRECGVKDENIINLNLCTSCNSDKFHSYRKHNKTQERIGTILQIK